MTRGLNLLEIDVLLIQRHHRCVVQQPIVNLQKKIDREKTNFERVFAKSKEALNAHVTPLYFPVGKEA